MVTIRPFDYSDADYAAVTAVWNNARPNDPFSVAYLRREDEMRTSQPGRVLFRLMAEAEDEAGQGGRCVGYGHFMHKPWSYHPRKLAFNITVLPEYESAGIDNSLYERLLGEMQAIDPLTLETAAYEDHPHKMRFLEERGYRVVQRSQDSELDTAGFDPMLYAGLLDKVSAGGIRICNLPDMLVEDPDFLRRLHALESELVADVPYYDSQVDATPYEDWVKSFTDYPELLPEANLVALAGDQLVGMTNLWTSLATDRTLYTGFTGVLPAYRRRGVATALKVRALAFAKQRLTPSGDPPLVRTGNEANNPMLQLNLRLGFKELPALLIYAKELT